MQISSTRYFRVTETVTFLVVTLWGYYAGVGNSFLPYLPVLVSGIDPYIYRYPVCI